MISLHLDADEIFKILNNVRINFGFYSFQISNNNYPFSMLTSAQIYWETILNLSIPSFPVMQRGQ